MRSGAYVSTRKNWEPWRCVRVNLFNRANFAPPADPVLFNSTGTRIPGSGRITALTTPARQVQLGVKLLF